MEIHSGQVTPEDLKKPGHDWSELNAAVRGLKPGDPALVIPVPPGVTMQHLRAVALGKVTLNRFKNSPWYPTSRKVVENGVECLKVWLMPRLIKR